MDAEADPQITRKFVEGQNGELTLLLESDNPRRFRSVVNGVLVDLDLILRTMEAFPKIA